VLHRYGRTDLTLFMAGIFGQRRQPHDPAQRQRIGYIFPGPRVSAGYAAPVPPGVNGFHGEQGDLSAIDKQFVQFCATVRQVKEKPALENTRPLQW
jgi:hypothetical protein